MIHLCGVDKTWIGPLDWITGLDHRIGSLDWIIRSDEITEKTQEKKHKILILIQSKSN